VPLAYAAAPSDGFALQVAPSPLVATMKPGESRELELKIRNASTKAEKLKIEVRSFQYKNDGTISLDQAGRFYATDWVSFKEPTFTIQPGQWYTQTVKISLPKEVGFSYYFALLMTQTDQKPMASSGQKLTGSIAVFTLINIDRPDATRKIDVLSLKSDRGLYEYLPAALDIRFKNTGNTIVQPYGDVFIYAGDDTTGTPVSTMKLNEQAAYLLPDTQRTLQTSWDEGFPAYKTTTDDSGNRHTNLIFDWKKVGDFRFGKFTAKIVAVYNDGTRDVPIMREVTFWVIPWKAILILIAIIVGLVLLLRFYIKKRTEKAVKKALARHSNQTSPTP